jgi:hypothetical protein
MIWVLINAYFEAVTDTNIKWFENIMETHSSYLETIEIFSISYSANAKTKFKFLPRRPQLGLFSVGYGLWNSFSKCSKVLWHRRLVYLLFTYSHMLFLFLLPLLLGSSLPYWSTGLITQFIDCLEAVGLLGRVISSSQGLYPNTGQHKHRKRRTHIKHLWPRWDSNVQSRPPSDRRLLMAQTARLPRPASLYVGCTK